MAIKFNRKLRTKAIVDMAPMIDIIFQLVIFFMVSTTFKTTTGIELQLPNAKNVTNITQAPLNITLMDKDNIIVGNNKISLEELPDYISEITKEDNSKKSVVIFGNNKMEYQVLISVMDILRDFGYENVDLAIDKGNNIK